MSKVNKKSVWYLRANFFGVLLLLLLFGAYLYQINEVASLEYTIGSKEEKLSRLEEKYQELSLKREQWGALAELRNRSRNLQMKEINSPHYILPPTKGFAQKE